jgi:protein-tyrosine-phosphatase
MNRYPRIAFVCTGNTGRSAISEALARSWCETHAQQAEIISRGVSPTPGSSAPEPQAAALLARAGLNIAAHRARPFTEADAAQCDLILTATAAHKAILHHRHPDAAAKTFTMCEYPTGHHADIADAFGQDAAFYFRVFNEIEAMIGPLLQRALARS